MRLGEAEHLLFPPTSSSPRHRRAAEDLLWQCEKQSTFGTKAQPGHVVTKRFKTEIHFNSCVHQIRDLQEALKFLFGQIVFF